MQLPVTNAPSAQANPHVLASIADASERCSIVAARDIVDTSGIKLWARNQAVSRALQERLAARDLAAPLEASLVATDGVSSADLAAELIAFGSSKHPLAALVQPHAQSLHPLAQRLVLHPAVQLLTTVVRESAVATFDHAIRAMAVAGAMCRVAGGAARDVELAMLGGLLHDVGEMYVDPRYLVEGDGHDTQSLLHIAAHPHVGQVLLSKLTDYPGALALAIAQHHERLDGSGFPAGLGHGDISELGRLLAVVDTVVEAGEGAGRAPLSRAQLAITFVPREYDQRWSSMLRSAARTEAAELDRAARLPAAEMQARLRDLNQALQSAQAEADELSFDSAHPTLRVVAQFASQRLAALRSVWAESGLWAIESSYDPHDGSGAGVELLERELQHRMKAAWRACALRCATLSDVERALLRPVLSPLHDVQAGGSHSVPEAKPA